MSTTLVLCLAIAGQCASGSCPRPTPIAGPIAYPAAVPYVVPMAPVAPRRVLPADTPRPAPEPKRPIVLPATPASKAGPAPAAPTVAKGRNYGLTLDKLALEAPDPGTGGKWESHGEAGHAFVRAAAGADGKVGAPADPVDDSGKSWLTLVGTEAKGLRAGLPPGVADHFKINEYDPGDWLPKLRGFQPGVTVQDPSGKVLAAGKAYPSAAALDRTLGRLEPRYTPEAPPTWLERLGLEALAGAQGTVFPVDCPAWCLAAGVLGLVVLLVPSAREARP